METASRFEKVSNFGSHFSLGITTLFKNMRKRLLSIGINTSECVNVKHEKHPTLSKSSLTKPPSWPRLLRFQVTLLVHLFFTRIPTKHNYSVTAITQKLRIFPFCYQTLLRVERTEKYIYCKIVVCLFLSFFAESGSGMLQAEGRLRSLLFETAQCSF